MREKERPVARHRAGASPSGLRNAESATGRAAGRRPFEIVNAPTRNILASI